MSSSDRDYASVGSLDNAPSPHELEQALRNTVISIFKSGNLEELTVKRVRLSAEKNLELEADFFKNDASWKEKSAAIIKEEVQRQDELGTGKENEPSQQLPPPPPSPQEKIRPAPKQTTSKETKATKSRKRKESAQTSTRRKGVEERDTNLEQPGEPQEQQSESEMSEVIDSEPEQPNPKKAKRAEKSEPVKPKRRKTSSTSSGARATKNNAALDPDQAEIKKLQGWLNSCGVRKMWFRELAPYETPKAKIQHLKDMLREAGMTGRYSIEKARNIREKRELQEDLAAVQEGARKWGTGADDTGDERKRGTSRAQAFAFLGDDDGEESD